MTEPQCHPESAAELALTTVTCCPLPRAGISPAHFCFFQFSGFSLYGLPQELLSCPF